MQHKRLDALPCPIARGLDRVGEWWSILILRDAFHGKRRFDQFQKSLGIAPNILSRRLRGLVEAGLMEKVRYNDRPPRDEYVLTAIGEDFRPVLRAMLTWGSKHFMPDGQEVALADQGAALPPAPRPNPNDEIRRQP
jgi:DNA-binding HxlR family transcriptional regulator